MHLKSLELFGFKSFPEKTVLKFNPGITVVVGPNGCGKSNVFDAIKWSLGEQRPKALRGAKMEDLIFNGTQSHPPLNYAETTLIFCNEDRYLPIEYKEVAVTRRLYRSGESQYCINKNMCRLKDIEELFMGTGIGESTYSFIEQGKVEALLSYKPEEKRLIFDEASGIGKYKEKKKETLRKLKDTEENILRLDDIITEVRRQTRYLERQVEKARKYKEISEELIEVEKKLAAHKVSGIEVSLKKLQEELERLIAQEAEKEEGAAEHARQIQDVRSQQRAIGQQQEEIHGRIVSTNSQIEKHHDHITINNQRIEEAQRRTVAIEGSLEESRKRIALQESRIADEKKALLSIEDAVVAAHHAIEFLQKEKAAARENIEVSRKTLKEKKEAILHFEEQKTKINNSLVEIGAHTKNLSARKKRLTIDEARITTYITEHNEGYVLLEKEVSSKGAECVGLKEQKTQCARRLKELRRLIEEISQQVIEKEKALVELNSYLEFLRELHIKYDEFSATSDVTVIFKEKPPRINKLIASLKDVPFHQIEEGPIAGYRAHVQAKIISLPEEELERRIAVISSEIQTLRSLAQEKKSMLSSEEETLTRHDELLHEQEAVLRAKQQELEIASDEMARFKEEYQLIERELSECGDELKTHESQKSSYDAQMRGVLDGLAEANAQCEASQECIARYTGKIGELDIHAAKKEAELKALSEHKESFYSKVALLEEERTNLLSAISSFEDEKKNAAGFIEGLEREIVSLNERISQAETALQRLSDERVSCQVRLEETETQLTELSENVKKREKELEELRDQIHARKMGIQKLDFEKTQVLDYLEQVYSVSVEAGTITQVEEDIPSLQRTRDSLKKQREKLGDVNLVAIDEFEELNSRFTFLSTQKEDLLSSRDSLKKAIQKINRTSKEVFLEIFTKIEEEFKHYFRYLFNGGRAQLVLLDQENILESGVEIEVQPPGKKLQNVSLLSGGEKALTAIALIFSIFKVRPSPICVLDEIDAPLDEANVERFNQLLKEFSPTSQFIVITHNKRTMSKADVLYGVTMQEKGISKLVSVRFQEEPASAQS